MSSRFLACCRFCLAFSLGFRLGFALRFLLSYFGCNHIVDFLVQDFNLALLFLEFHFQVGLFLRQLGQHLLLAFLAFQQFVALHLLSLECIVLLLLHARQESLLLSQLVSHLLYLLRLLLSVVGVLLNIPQSAESLRKRLRREYIKHSVAFGLVEIIMVKQLCVFLSQFLQFFLELRFLGIDVGKVTVEYSHLVVKSLYEVLTLLYLPAYDGYAVGCRFLVLLILVQQPVGHLDILLSLTLLALERLDCLLRADGDRYSQQNQYA